VIDYVKILDKVDTAIIDAGTQVTILKTRRTPTDTDKPWNGAVSQPVVTYTPHNKKTVYGVKIQKHVPQGDVFKLIKGSTLKEGSTYFLFSGKKVPEKFDFDKIQNADNLWTVIGVETIQPATLRLLHIVEVET
jgi:hypothetical protein